MLNVPKLQHKDNDESNKLMKEVSSLLFRANAHASSGCKEEAAAFFERAAGKERLIAQQLEDDGYSNNAVICWMSAASHYADAGKYRIAASLLEEILPKPTSEGFRHEIEWQLDRCNNEARNT